MNILHVNKYYPPWIGGIEKIVADIASACQDAFLTSRVLVCQSPNKPTTQELHDTVHVTRAKTLMSLFGMPISPAFVFAFKKEMETTDVILIHHPFPLGLLAYALFGRNKRMFIFYHADIVRQHLLAKLLTPLWYFAFARADKIFVTSQITQRTSPFLKSFQEKCLVVPLWVDEELPIDSLEMKKQTELIRNTYGMPLLLCVGRLVSYKGYTYLIDAMKQISAHLLIIGSGPLKQDLLTQIQTHYLENRVTIIDPVEHLAPYYKAADLFLFPSISKAEAFGIVQLEAMFYGCPVINTNLLTAVPDVSIHGISGLTVEPKNSLALVEAIQKLLSDPTERERLSKGAQNRARTVFSKQKSLEIIKQVILKKPL